MSSATALQLALLGSVALYGTPLGLSALLIGCSRERLVHWGRARSDDGRPESWMRGLTCRFPRLVALLLAVVPLPGLAAWPWLVNGQRVGVVMLLAAWAAYAVALACWSLLCRPDEDDDGGGDDDEIDDDPDGGGGLKLDFERFDRLRSEWGRRSRQRTPSGSR